MTKILLVDDSEDVIAFLSHRFAALNFEVKSARMASVAIEMMQRESFDVVLSDVVMPGMNGVEFMNSISSLPGAFQVIFMSGAASETTGETLLRMGALGFLKKPIDFDELTKLVEKAVGKAKGDEGGKPARAVQANRANVMIVDDMALVADLLKTLLERQGFNVFTANDGYQGVELFKQHKIDLVVTDLVMPKMNGVEMIKELKALREDLPIMAITGEAMNLSIQDALNSGASMCIRKPFPNQLFVDKVEGLFMQQQRSATRHQAVTGQETTQSQKLSLMEKFRRDPVKGVSMAGLILFSFLLALYMGSYVFVPATEGQSITDVDDRLDQLLEAIRMDWGR